ncbi:multicopper oxidase family protein [Dyella mobilis]|uniref:Multicopper oxidase domain-containing protein n=1 Tax=Dyella mobilis TaxID=1849582 RepID=A0ABS2KES1_9GAMM|nr:multicopper oxidase domain-containing protein [Dyella mobilis]MBM7129584.1 multicopper oxidase domain-containing protein [Dyella mobilis]GLQ98152.1 multicopper oxidase MmcO [Dyella mobilis]
MPIDRRDFLKLGGLAALSSGLPTLAQAAGPAMAMAGNADYTLRIARSLVELSPDHIVSTTTYNDQFPGPLIRLKEGRRVVVDVYNDTDVPEQLHWHGQFLPVDVDGAAEEGTPYIPAHGMRRLSFVPGPGGLRFYHTHVVAGSDLTLGQYSGQVGPVYIEPRHEPGNYDHEIFLTLKEFDPFFSKGGDMAMDFLRPAQRDRTLEQRGESAMQASLASGHAKGYEVGYQAFAINGRALGSGEPIRVKQGERVLLHVLNGSATEIRSLALPGHVFKVIALDGNPVPHPADVPVLWIGTAERISAVVEMNHPGTWVLGDLDDDDRGHGMGIVVEYAGHSGKPQWIAPPPFGWDYRLFALPNTRATEPEQIIDLTFAKQNAADHSFNRWTINGVAFDMQAMKPMFQLAYGKRYRLRMHNGSDDIHPMHLHRHSFEIASIAGQPTGGIIKDVAMLGGYQSMEVDFTADQRGLSLFHCHVQLHQDFGFMALFECA